MIRTFMTSNIDSNRLSLQVAFGMKPWGLYPTAHWLCISVLTIPCFRRSWPLYILKVFPYRSKSLTLRFRIMEVRCDTEKVKRLRVVNVALIYLHFSFNFCFSNLSRVNAS